MTRFYSSRIKTTIFKKETPYVVKNQTGHKFKDWIFNKMWNVFCKWGNVKQHIDEVEIETFDFTDSKRKVITERIIEEMRRREAYHGERVTPDTHVVVMGEKTFFEMMDEKRNNSPFFSDNFTFMTNDMYYNDPYNGRRVLQFSCHVVKGMVGFAIIPKVYIEVRK